MSFKMILNGQILLAFQGSDKATELT